MISGLYDTSTCGPYTYFHILSPMLVLGLLMLVTYAMSVSGTTGKKIVLEPTYTYIYKQGIQLQYERIHSAPTKKSLSKSFFGLQPSGFRLSQAETFFYWSHSNCLQYNNPLIKKISAKTHWTYENPFGQQGFVH